jgi:hypothetical protein
LLLLEVVVSTFGMDHPVGGRDGDDGDRSGHAFVSGCAMERHVTAPARCDRRDVHEVAWSA